WRVQVRRRARTGTAGGEDQVDDVALDGRIHVDLVDGLLEEPHVLEGHGPRGLARSGQVPGGGAVQDLVLLPRARIGEDLLHQEAIHLRLGEAVGALLPARGLRRSEEHTSELRSRFYLAC